MKFLRTCYALIFALALCLVPARADSFTLLVDSNGVIQFNGFWPANSNQLNAVVSGGTNNVTISQINTISNLLQAGYIATNTASLSILTNYVTGALGSYLTSAATLSAISATNTAALTTLTNYYTAQANFGLGANYVTFTNGFNVIPIVLGSSRVFMYLGGTTNDPIIQFSTSAP